MKTCMHGGTVLLLVGVAVLGLWQMGRGGLRAEELGAWATVWGAVGLAAALHEAGHLAAAWGMAVRVRGMRLELLGARVVLGGMLSYRQEAAVAMGGPFVSLAVGAMLWPFCTGGGFAEVVCVSSLGLGVFNLLPVETMDGGRTVWCLLSATVGERVADAVVRVCTGAVLGGLFAVATYGLLVRGTGVTLFGFSVCLLVRLAAGETDEKKARDEHKYSCKD